VDKRWQRNLGCCARWSNSCSIWDHPYRLARKLWQSLCCIWRDLHSAFNPLGWQIDNVVPDRFDLIGGLIALIGVIVIMYWPRVGS
jgi:hypothetical protein